MTNEISLEYGDVLKAYQIKSGELLTQLITAEARLNASATLIAELKNRIFELEKQQSSFTSANITNNDLVIDYNS